MRLTHLSRIRTRKGTWKSSGKYFMEIQLEETIKNFYGKNNIESKYYTDSIEEAYSLNKKYDKKIAFSSLQKRVGEWIQFFEKEDQEYFLQLLENFTYITKEALLYRVYHICKNLFEYLLEKGIDYSEIIFVVMESPNGVKAGADEMAVNLWNINQEYEISKEQIITAFSKVDERIIERARAIIFFDDIVATGFTMLSQIEIFLKRFENVCDNSRDYYYTSVLFTKNALAYLKKKLRGKVVEIQPFYHNEQIIRSAFKGDYIFEADVVNEVENVVKKYEDVIDAYEKENPVQSFSMGFRQCKLLLAFHYEVPNNTLCSFWKATDENAPVFARSRYSRLSVDRLKKQKMHMKENAYLHKALNRGVKK